MDLYITDSLQDMLDIDIKSEMATDLGSNADFSETFGVSFSDLPPLLDIDMDNATTWITGSNSNSHSSSSFVHSLDLYGSEANAVMVNPNSVMPSIFSESPIKKEQRDSLSVLMSPKSNYSLSRSPSPVEVKTPLSPADSKSLVTTTIKVELVESEDDAGCEEEPVNSKYIVIKKDSEIKDESDTGDEDHVILPTHTIQTLKLKTANQINGRTCINQSVNGTHFIKTQNGPQTIISGNIQILGHQQSRALLNGSNKNSATILIDNGTLNNNRQILKTTTINSSNSNNESTKYISNNKLASYCIEFPKPAYSYSCLIAMALKNSRTGSLPVAEIYNFMCQHFPYFKTAPNGWKNSVRHNLSLNKCFEKIEKPSTNGGQRKGCLWAMNPSKVGKMDEEVQKWSRKDPQAIRKAMVRPESLEALERGEMKFCSESNGDDYCSEEEELDVDETYLVTSSPSGSPAITQQYDDETSDVEVMEGMEIEESKPLMLEFSLSSQFHTDSPAKRAKTSYIYQTVSAAPSHANRRKAPLVNRIA